MERVIKMQSNSIQNGNQVIINQFKLVYNPEDNIETVLKQFN